jgi:hypothetical protein
MTSGSPPSFPFVAGSKIEDSWRFVGRKDELHAIASRMSGVQPTSVNVVLFKIQRSEADSLFAILLQSLHVIPFEQ